MHRAYWPHIALILNAAVWGLSWWPLRQLQQNGLHPLWASAATYAFACAVLLLLKPKTWAAFFRNPALWVLAMAAGCTMVGFNWGVTIAEVIRVVLLFYLMPIWAVMLAYCVLNEPIQFKSAMCVGLAIFGAILVLSPSGQLGFPVPRTLGEWLGLLGGMAFALNNVMLRHQAKVRAELRLFAMFIGGAIIPVGVALALWLTAFWVHSASPLGTSAIVQHTPLTPNALWQVPLPMLHNGWGAMLLVFVAMCLLLANFGLQYGAARLPAHVTAVVMLSEVLFATFSAIWLAGEHLSLQVALGGLLICLAALLSAYKTTPLSKPNTQHMDKS